MSAAVQPIEPHPIQISAGRIFLVQNQPAPLVHLYEERHCPECGFLRPHHDKNCYLRLEECA